MTNRQAVGNRRGHETGYARPTARIRANRTAAFIPAQAGIQVPTPWAPASAAVTTKDWLGRGPYIGEDPKLTGHLESARYNFWDKAKLPILLKTKEV